MRTDSTIESWDPESCYAWSRPAGLGNCTSSWKPSTWGQPFMSLVFSFDQPCDRSNYESVCGFTARVNSAFNLSTSAKLYVQIADSSFSDNGGNYSFTIESQCCADGEYVSSVDAGLHISDIVCTPCSSCSVGLTFEASSCVAGNIYKPGVDRRCVSYAVSYAPFLV